MRTENGVNRRKGALRGFVRKVAAASVVAAALASSIPAYGFLARPIIFAQTGAVTKTPGGWLQLCAETPEECRPMADTPRDVTLTPELLQQLFSINAYVSDRVKWTSDAELYGKAERWAYPFDRGDCEDIVLLKRRLLAKAGWPISSLLITIVDDRNTDKGRHAVLTVRTDRGEMILDNQTPEILFWYETPYHYLARQSTIDPNVWVSFTEQPKPVAVSTVP